MAKCRMLIQENQELGRQLSQGRIAQLEAELALQKKYGDELKSSQDGEGKHTFSFIPLLPDLLIVLNSTLLLLHFSISTLLLIPLYHIYSTLSTPTLYHRSSHTASQHTNSPHCPSPNCY